MTKKGTVLKPRVYAHRTGLKGPRTIMRPIIPPGTYTCPQCASHTGTLDELEQQRTEHDAGGKRYWWRSFVGWLVCTMCDYRWSEAWS